MINSKQALKTTPTLYWGLLAITAIMPFHAFLSIYLGSLTGQQTLIQAWKEILIATLGVVAGVKLLIQPELRQRLKSPVNYAILGFILISLSISLINHQTGTRQFWYGAKTDFEFLIIFVIAQLALGPKLEQRLTHVILASSALVALFATLQATILEKSFLTNFGFGPHTIAAYQLIDPALPNTIRVIGTLAGPNQLGSFLILPICLIIYLIVLRRQLALVLPFGLFIYALVHSYSRSAWIGTAIAVCVTILFYLPRKFSLPISLSGLAILSLLLWQSPNLLAKYPRLQYIFLHSQSTGSLFRTSNQGHSESLKQGLGVIQKHPLGLGLGSAGPASFQSKTTLITENYYLQIGIEAGLLGLILFLIINLLLAQKLLGTISHSTLAIPCLAALAGLAAANLFLHAYSDSTTALIFWGTAGVAIATTKGES